MRRTAVLAVAAALLAAAAPADGAWRDLRVGSIQRSVDASPGSGCGTAPDGSGACADAAYPLPLRGTLFVRRGHRIAFDFSQVVDAVHVDGIEVQREWNGTRWFGTVPPDWPAGFRRVGVSSSWSGGDQHFEVGLHVLTPRKRWVRVPRVVGLTHVQALVALERRGLRWRFRGSPQRHFDSGPPIPPNAVAALAPPPRTQSLRAGKRVRRGTVVLLGL